MTRHHDPQSEPLSAEGEVLRIEALARLAEGLDLPIDVLLGDDQ